MATDEHKFAAGLIYRKLLPIGYKLYPIFLAFEVFMAWGNKCEIRYHFPARC